VHFYQGDFEMDEFMASDKIVKLKLANGQKVNVRAGTKLPDGLPDDFTVLIAPHLLTTVVPQDILISANLSYIRSKIVEGTLQCKTRTRFLMKSARNALKEVIDTGVDKIYADMMSGVPEGVRLWRNFCDDSAIIVTCMASLGHNVTVMIDTPQLLNDDIKDKSAFFAGLLFIL
jgi:hypothetical protein